MIAWSTVDARLEFLLDSPAPAVSPSLLKYATSECARHQERHWPNLIASYRRKQHNVHSKIGDWTVNGKLHCNMHNKHYHLLALMTLQHFLKVRCESMIVKFFYVTSQIQLQKWIHKSKTFAWYKLLVKQQHEIWNGTKHSYTYKLCVQMKILKLTRSKSNGRSGGKTCTHSPVNIVNSYN